jgi:hypothetical protein
MRRNFYWRNDLRGVSKTSPSSLLLITYLWSREEENDRNREKGRNINNRARSVFKVLLLVHEAGGERHKTRAEEEESKLSSQSFNLEAEKISSFSPSMVSSRANQIYCSLLIVYTLCYAVYVCSKYATLASLRLLSALTALIITLVSPGKKINQWETWHNVA